MKEEVPPPLVDAHLRTVQDAVKDGISVDANFGLDRTGIAGTGPEKADRESGILPSICFYLLSGISYFNMFFFYLSAHITKLMANVSDLCNTDEYFYVFLHLLCVT